MFSAKGKFQWINLVLPKLLSNNNCKDEKN